MKPPWGLAWRLAWGQILLWGILYYAFTALSAPIHEDTGWSRPLIHGGLSLGLLTWGVLALPVGMWIQRNGARGIMMAGSLLGGLAFASFGLASEPWHFYLAWVGTGAAMAATLYEPAFAAVTMAFGNRYKQGIVLVTLLGGLASTVFIPLTHFLTEQIGWRQTCLVLGLSVVALGVPLHRTKIQAAPANSRRSPNHRRWSFFDAIAGFRKDFSDRTFLLLSLWFSAHTAAFSGLIFLIVPAMSAAGASSGALLGAMALIGPMQVLGRLAIAARGGEFSSIQTGSWAMISMTLSLIILIVMPSNFAWLACFGVLFGLGNGIMTIMKGTAIAEFFDRARYAELNGAIAAPSVMAKAGAPLLLSAVWQKTAQPELVFVVLLILMLIGLAAVLGLARMKSQRIVPPNSSHGDSQ
ncbi:MFS transporter [Haloferula chungangensis]|uniref:MFS transporter n=1 Tax=Haloferula chungangensis TaxID=1048331 RepID=A0ABW2LAU4_9BACT